jgi:hypothetical protein
VREVKAYRITTPQFFIIGTSGSFRIVRLTTVLCDDEETGWARQDEGWDVETGKYRVEQGSGLRMWKLVREKGSYGIFPGGKECGLWSASRYLKLPSLFEGGMRVYERWLGRQFINVAIVQSEKP